MKFKKITTFLASLLIISTLSACSTTSSNQVNEVTANNSKQTLTLGLMGCIDAVPIVIAKEKQFFEETGVDVNIEIFKSAKDRDAALTAGSLDGVLCDDVAISIYQNAGLDMKITGVTDGYWTLVAGKDSGITSIADLKSKKVGISENTMIEYVIDDIVTKNNMPVSDIEKVAIPAMPTRLEMLRNNQIDAALLPAPFNDIALADGGMKISEVTNNEINISVISFSQNSIDTKTSEIQSFISAYDKAVNYLNTTNIKEYEDIIISTVGYSEDMKGKLSLPKFRENTLPPESDVQNVLNWSKEKGLLTKDINAKDVIIDIKSK